MKFESSFGYRNKPGIQEGKDLEKGIFGSTNAEFESASYVPYKEAMQVVLESDPGPLSDSISELKSKVFNNISPESGYIRVRSALGTPLDIYHGVDAVMEYEGKIATIDVTSNPEKIVSGAKADIILSATLDDDGIPQIDPNDMEQAAADISRLLMNKNDSKRNSQLN